MKILICDDDKKVIKEIETYLQIFSKSESYRFETKSYTDGNRVMQMGEAYDIAFVDIEMPAINGLNVVKHLKKEQPGIIIFVVTSFQGYLDEAMDMNIFRYISKPIDKQRFMSGLQSAMDYYHQNNEKIVITHYSDHYNVYASDILFLTIEKRKTKVVTKDGVYFSSDGLDVWRDKLHNYGFFAQSHCSYIINLKNVTNFRRYELTMEYGSSTVTLPISRSYYLNFKQAFYGYIGGTA